MIETYSADGKSKSGHRGDRADGLLQDRFQGAVMGLWMVPMALQSNGFHYDSIHDSSTRDFDAGSGASSLGPGLSVGVDDDANLLAIATSHLAEINTFLHSPQRFRSSVADSDSVLSSLPPLLRYHSDSVRRCRAIFELSSSRELKQGKARARKARARKARAKKARAKKARKRRSASDSKVDIW